MVGRKLKEGEEENDH